MKSAQATTAPPLRFLAHRASETSAATAATTASSARTGTKTSHHVGSNGFVAEAAAETIPTLGKTI